MMLKVLWQKQITRKHMFLLGAAVVLLDQFAKWIVVNKISRHDSVSIINGLFNIVHWENSGAAFDLLGKSSASWKIKALIVFSLLTVFFIAVLIWRASYPMSIMEAGLSLVLGGAIGNLLDRLISGQVVDFLDFHVGSHHWPAFNLADSAIVVGAMMLLLKFYFAKSNDPVKNSL